jgi:hypothetical protein
VSRSILSQLQEQDPVLQYLFHILSEVVVLCSVSRDHALVGSGVLTSSSEGGKAKGG